MKARRRTSEAAQVENVILDHDDRWTGAWSRSICFFLPITPINATASSAWIPAGAAAAAAVEPVHECAGHAQDALRLPERCIQNVTQAT